MSKEQWKVAYSYAFILAIIAGIYAITQTPAPRLDLAIWGMIFGGWALVWRSPVFGQWRADLQQIYRAMFLLMLFMLPLYFLVRLAGAPIAFIVVGLITLYFVLVQFVAMLLIGNKLYEDAYRYLDTMLKIFPRQSALYTQKAYGHLMQEKFEQAVQFATQAIDISLENRRKSGKKSALDAWTLQAYNMRLLAYLNQRDGAKALPDANLVVRATPQEPQAYINRGIAELYVDNLVSAQADLEHAIRIAVLPQQQFFAQDALGLVFYRLDNYAAAMTHYIKASQISLSARERLELLPRSYMSMASVHFMQNDMQSAWQAVRTANTINPQSLDTRISLAVMYAVDEAWDEAVQRWHILVAEDHRLADIDYLEGRYFRWTPKLSELMKQIVSRLEPVTA